MEERIRLLEQGEASPGSAETNAVADNDAELNQLRAEMARLRNIPNELAHLKTGATKPSEDKTEDVMRAWSARVNKLKQRLDENPSLKIPEFSLFTEKDWLNIARLYTKRTQFDEETDFLVTAAEARQSAQSAFAELAKTALKDYARANKGGFPSSPDELKPFFKPPIDDAILDRYTIERAEKFGRNDKGQDRVLTQKALVDEKRDHPIFIGPVLWGYFQKK